MSASFDPKFIKFSVIGVTGAQMRTSLLAYFTMDEASGTVFDSTATNYDLSSLDSPTYAEAGKISNAINFSPNATSALYTSSYAPIAPSGTAYTISAWVRLDSLPSTQSSFMTIISRGVVASPYVSVRMRLTTTDAFTATIWSSSAVEYELTSTASVLAINTWYHIVAVFGGSGVTGKLWVNGTNVLNGNPGGQPATVLASDNDFTIGNNFYGGSENVHGRIDEVGIWDRALTDAEVAYLYNGGNGRTYNFD